VALLNYVKLTNEVYFSQFQVNIFILEKCHIANYENNGYFELRTVDQSN